MNQTLINDAKLCILESLSHYTLFTPAENLLCDPFSAKDFPLNIPLVIIGAEENEEPYESNLKLALNIAQYRYTKSNSASVYFLPLEKSSCKDDQWYKNFIYTVYKKHGIYFDEKYLITEKDIQIYELTQGYLSTQIRYQTHFNLQKGQQDWVRTQAFLALKPQISSSSPEQRTYAKKICPHMPLYSIHTPLTSHADNDPYNRFQRRILMLLQDMDSDNIPNQTAPRA